MQSTMKELITFLIDYTPRQIKEALKIIEAIEDAEVENYKERQKAGEEFDKLAKAK